MEFVSIAMSTHENLNRFRSRWLSRVTAVILNPNREYPSDSVTIQNIIRRIYIEVVLNWPNRVGLAQSVACPPVAR